MTRPLLQRLQATATHLRRRDRVCITASAKRLRPLRPRNQLPSPTVIQCIGDDEWHALAAGVSALAIAAVAASAHSDSQTQCTSTSVINAPALAGDGTSIHDAYEITDEIIGEGGYCVVHRGVDRRTGEAVAVKILGKRETPAREFWTEVDVLRTAGHHPNIMQLRGVFESDDCWYIVQELASEGELFDHLIENGAYSEQQASVAIRELCDALHYLHRKGIVHGDIKPENILLHNGRMCLVDFGVSFRVGEQFFADAQLTGTVAYAAPETLRHSNNHPIVTEGTGSSNQEGNQPRLGPQADMFALGVVLYILLCGSHPFDPYNNLTDDEIRYRIVRGKFSRQTRAWQSISPPARDLIEKLLEPNPDTRLSAGDAMRHRWLAKTADLPITPIAHSAELLERFQRGRRRLRASILGVLLMDALGDGDSEQPAASLNSVTMGVSSSAVARSHKTDALWSTLGVFDRENKGFITKHDLARVSTKLGRPLSESELNEMLVGATGDPEKAAASIDAIGYDDVKLAISSLRSASYEPGEVLIRQGHTGPPHVFLLLDGEVEVTCKNPIKQHTPPPVRLGTSPSSAANSKKQRPAEEDVSTQVTINRIGKGSFFGQIELLRPDGQLHPRIATYTCASDSPCKVLQLVADDFLNISDAYASINAQVASSARIHTQEQLIKCVEAARGHVTKRTLAAGEFVYHEGEERDSFFIVLDGGVEVLRQHEQIVVEQLTAGDYFPLGVSGQTSNCAIHTRHYSVRCTQPTTVVEIGGETFRSFLHSDQFMASYFRQEIKAREQRRVDKHRDRTAT